MSDIVERLRRWRIDSWPVDPSNEAADEIERLRAVVEAAKWVVHLFFDEIVLDSVNDSISKQLALDQLAMHVRALDGGGDE